jgi:hypothetical protein
MTSRSILATPNLKVVNEVKNKKGDQYNRKIQTQGARIKIDEF